MSLGESVPRWWWGRSLRGRTVALLLAAGLLLPTPTARQAPLPLYPDLRTLPPSWVFLDQVAVDGSIRHVLRFTTTIWNAGQGPLELRGASSSDKTRVYQRVYEEGGSFSELLVGEFTYHQAHNHWHFESFADYELWSKADYDRWLASGRQVGQPRWRGSKTTGQGESFCVRDSEVVESLPGSPEAEVYSTCDRAIQGISVGWGDTYQFFLDEQWIDLGEAPLPDGRYMLRVIADPRNLLHESENGDDPARESAQANEAITAFEVRGVFVEITEMEKDPAGDLFSAVSFTPGSGSLR